MQAPATASIPLSPRAARFTLLATILGSSMVFVDASVVNVALPAIQRDLGGGLATQQWIADAYLLTLGSLILVGGSLGDIFGEVRVFTLGVVAFGAASVLCAVAPDAAALIVFRGLQGVSGALLTPASLAVITSTFSGQERGAAIGSWTAWTGISFVVGTAARRLADRRLDLAPDLRPQRAARVRHARARAHPAAAQRLAQERRPRRRRRRGALRRRPRRDRLRLHRAAAARLGRPGGSRLARGGRRCLATFVLYESRAAMPMLPLRLFARRNFSVTNLETFAVYGGLSAWSFFLTLFLQQVAGYSPFRAGLATVPLTIVMFFLSRYVGRLSMRVGPRLFMGVGPLLAGAATLPIARLPGRLDYWTELLPALLAFALGLAMTVAPLTTTVLNDAGPGDAGIASGVNNAVARVAGLIAIAAVGIAASSGANLSTQGFHRAMFIVAGLLAAGGAVGAAGIRNPVRA